MNTKTTYSLVLLLTIPSLPIASMQHWHTVQTLIAGGSEQASETEPDAELYGIEHPSLPSNIQAVPSTIIYTRCIHAITSANSDALDHLLKNSILYAKLAARIAYKQPLLDKAAQENNTAAITCLLAANANVNIRWRQLPRRTRLYGSTYTLTFPLYTAIRHNALDAVRLLITHHADVNMQTHSGKTALMKALIELSRNTAYNPEIVSLLLKTPDLDSAKRTHTGVTALHYAAVCGQHIAWQPINQSYRNRYLPLVKALLQHGASNVPDSHTLSPLHYALYGQFPEAAQEIALHAAGEDIERDERKASIIRIASGSRHHHPVVHYIFEHYPQAQLINQIGIYPAWHNESVIRKVNVVHLLNHRQISGGKRRFIHHATR